MSNIVRVGAYGYQKRQVIALEDAETRVLMGLDSDVWETGEADVEDVTDLDAPPPDGDERVLNAGRAM